MSSDRELLELAAKANGYQVKGWVGEHLVFFNPITESAEERWNPLSDDGDALRLAMKLELLVSLRAGEIIVYGDFYSCDFVVDSCYRRAIARAAAEIGKALP